uniref:Uncharacterized protein n=1 Tax=Anguilla anguilla TaxID=7936 RepID=A0A0E9V6G0_ANGAN
MLTYVVPGIHPYFYIGSEALNHTEEYTVAAGMFRHRTDASVFLPNSTGITNKLSKGCSLSYQKNRNHSL